MPMSVTGTALRVRFSDAFGYERLQIGAARVARSGDNAAPLPNTERVLLFDGRPTTTLAPGIMLSSDAADLGLPGSLVIPGPVFKCHNRSVIAAMVGIAR